MRKVCLFIVACGLAASTAQAQAPYNRLDAARESYQLHEQQRRYRVGAQAQLNEDMIFWSRPYWQPYGWFEPWPFVPGDIYGYPLPEPPVNQPIGQRHTQLGPNTWVSRPIYADEPAVEEYFVDEPVGPREF